MAEEKKTQTVEVAKTITVKDKTYFPGTAVLLEDEAEALKQAIYTADQEEAADARGGEKAPSRKGK